MRTLLEGIWLGAIVAAVASAVLTLWREWRPPRPSIANRECFTTSSSYEPPLLESGRVTMYAVQAQLPGLEWED